MALWFDGRVQEFYNLIEEYLSIDGVDISVFLHREYSLNVVLKWYEGCYISISVGFNSNHIYIDENGKGEKFGVAITDVKIMLERFAVIVNDFKALIGIMQEVGCKFSLCTLEREKTLRASVEIPKAGRYLIQDGHFKVSCSTSSDVGISVPLCDPDALTNIRKAILLKLTS